MAKTIVWAFTIVASIAIVAYFSNQSDVEDSKQRAFLGKACVDAGGQWQHEWSYHYNCTRPK